VEEAEADDPDTTGVEVEEAEADDPDTTRIEEEYPDTVALARV
jgi:hypothetical protein